MLHFSRMLIVSQTPDQGVLAETVLFDAGPGHIQSIRHSRDLRLVELRVPSGTSTRKPQTFATGLACTKFGDGRRIPRQESRFRPHQNAPLLYSTLDNRAVDAGSIARLTTEPLTPAMDQVAAASP
jgi:hypothetical protein